MVTVALRRSFDAILERESFNCLTLHSFVHSRPTDMAISSLRSLQDRFTPCKRLCQTLYGEATLCQDEFQHKKLVVLKRIDLRLLEESGNSEDPLRELAVMQLLEHKYGHDHIVGYEPLPDGMFRHGDNVFVVMEYCAGGDLYTYVQRQPESRLREQEALKYLHQIALGVHFLHDHGFAHRDLSLENVLLQRRTAKICDFGLSIQVIEDALCTDRVGKLYYMAPEVALGQPYRPKNADVWSLGILLFILLTGSPLISSETTRESTLQILQQTGVAAVLTQWNMHVDKATADLLTCMLQIDPNQRATIDDVLQHSALRLR